MVLALVCAWISIYGALAGLILGQMHVWWRHTTEIGWKSPAWLVRLSRVIGLVLPEDHDGHHRNPEIEFGDIFRFYDAPARATIAWLRSLNPKRRAAAVRRAAALKRRNAALKRRAVAKQTS
jgi:sterol desaturase/sphingolipid hydroxylase (fatty acid hydroxylase superfamily)